MSESSLSSVNVKPETGETGETNVLVPPKQGDRNYGSKRQLSALTRRTLTYHKRRWHVDLCCLGICPALSVVIAGVLVIVVTHFANLSSNTTLSAGANSTSNIATGFLSCAREQTGTNPIYFPNQDFNSAPSLVTLPSGSIAQAVNFHLEPFQIGNLYSSLLGGFGSSATTQAVIQAGSTGLLPCLMVLTKDYDNSSPYAPVTTESQALRVDSTYLPDPAPGWFGLGAATGFSPSFILPVFQSSPVLHLIQDDGLAADQISYIGSRNQIPPVIQPLQSSGNGSTSTTALTSLALSPQLAALSAISYLQNWERNNTYSGLLSQMDTVMYVNVTLNQTLLYHPGGNATGLSPDAPVSNGGTQTLLRAAQVNSLQLLPYFINNGVQSREDVDLLIAQDITATINYLTSLRVSLSDVRIAYYSTTPRRITSALRAISGVGNMPFGALRFTDATNFSLSYEMQIGWDTRLSNVPSFPPPGRRQMIVQSQLARSLAKTLNLNVDINPSYRIMPDFVSIKFDIPASLLSARVLFPFGISFFIPVFCYMLVQEKQQRIFILMKMNGLKPWLYLVAHYIEFFISGALALTVFLIVARLFRLEIVSINAGPVIILLLVWLNVAIAFSFAISVLYVASFKYLTNS